MGHSSIYSEIFLKAMVLSCSAMPALSAVLGCVSGEEISSFVPGRTWLCHHFVVT